MLTIQTYDLLKDLQSFDKPVIDSIDKSNNQIKIFDKKYASSIYLGYAFPPKDSRFIKTYRYDEYSYLLENHYILIHDNIYISFTHIGYRIEQITLTKVIWHLIFSVIIPFLVAYYTSK